MDKSRDIYYGKSLLSPAKKKVEGGIIEVDGEKYYRISHYDAMPPFFLSIVSPSDHWMFVSSRGGLTCGRKDAGNALFPYYTDDKIHDASPTNGPKSVFVVEKDGRSWLWEPFRTDLPEVYETSRNLYKNAAGNKLIFEEINHNLKLGFRYAWMNSDRFGFVRQAGISNLDSSPAQISLFDGLQNLLPYGVEQQLQSNMSTLVDGYKKCELHPGKGLGIYTLSSIPTDKAEPSEALKATTAWCVGLKHPTYHLSTDALESFIHGKGMETETLLKGRRGSYFVCTELELPAHESAEWLIIADLSQGPSDVRETQNLLEKSSNLKKLVLDDISLGTKDLKNLVSMADGRQSTAKETTATRHFSNTLFNIMRGGIFPDNYRASSEDFGEFLSKRNTHILEQHKDFLKKLPKTISHQELIRKARETKDPDLIRLSYEYLPLTFSRRHGDPSRPWNRFSIDVKKPDGSRKLYYEGNWRDIFQNWEALALSYPGYIESFIARFVNASTVDGYNPYRVTRNGIDWEVPDPDDPWSNIGYWGDHQVIYLLKFIELSQKYYPGKLQDLLLERIFTYANVPYRIRPYEELLKDPHNSIDFDPNKEKAITERMNTLGSDGRLVFHPREETLKVNLTEKLLVLILSKLSNFVPEGGIWMNTQRPEWNDANNALAGYGLSMVTLYYLRRFLSAMPGLFTSASTSYEVSEEVEGLFRSVFEVLSLKKDLLRGRISDSERREIVDRLGRAGGSYRQEIYKRGVSGLKSGINGRDIHEFFTLALEFINHSIKANRRADGLYHSYNLVEFGKNSCRVSPLYEMLEGQVAVLSSGFLDSADSLEVLDSLRESKMYRPDQDSYTLYPDRELPGFLEKNVIPADKLSRSPFLAGELKSGRRLIVEKDLNGNYHFNGSLRNASELRDRLEALGEVSKEETDTICELFVDCFKHREFTGRSGTFFKYEGLGCIYWHMVSKLLLAVQEIYLQAEDRQEDPLLTQRLKVHYDQIKAGLGLQKSPEEYGAFPTDPYSHTPGFAGVQQPGMTGQVKEDFISRFGELGVIIANGCIRFNPGLLSPDEFHKTGMNWEINGRKIELQKGELGFTLCGTPVIYRLGTSRSIHIEKSTGEKIELPDTDTLDQNFSNIVFSRTGELNCIKVDLSIASSR